MTASTLKKFIMTAPFKEVKALEKLFAARAEEEREKAEIEAAIARGLADVEAGRVYTADEVDRHLREYMAELENRKCFAAK